MGDEGGFAPDLKSNEEALSFISEAVSNAGYKLGSEVYFALDVAATEIYKNKKYRIDKKDNRLQRKLYFTQLFLHSRHRHTEQYVVSTLDPAVPIVKVARQIVANWLA